MSRNPFATPDQTSKPVGLSLLQPSSTMPTFPLSSPINEEVITPFDSPDSPTLGDMASDTHHNPFESPEDSLLANHNTKNNDNSLRKTNKNSMTRLSKNRMNSMRRTTRLNSIKKIRPGLNVVTTFSTKAAVPPPEQVKVGGKHFIGVGDLKTLNDVKQQLDRSRLLPGWKKSSNKGYEDLESYNGSNRVGKRSLSRKFSKKGNGKGQELSPSDRPIPIGISVPFDSPEAASTSQRPSGSPRSEKTPVTPSIVITPAADNHDWDDAWKKSPPRRVRPASSVYSQPTPLMKNNNHNKSDSIPPVPALPPPGQYANWFGNYEIPIEQENVPQSAVGRRRAFSDGTMFEEDELSPSKLHARARASSVHSRHGLSRYSMDTIATRPRSQGWWNVLLSPLLSRSSTMTTIHRGTPDDEKPPAVPPLNIPSHLINPVKKQDNYMSEKEWANQVSVFSPITPDSADREKKVESNITEWPGPKEWDVGREKNMTFVNINIHNNPSPKLRQVENRNSPTSAVSSQSIPFVMSHATGDTSSAGFFHSPPAAATRGNTGFGYPNNYTYEKPRGQITYSPASCTSTPTATSPSSPFFRRFVETLRNDRRLSRCRSDSGSTMIDEDEPDVSPNVREARATPIFRGGVTPTMVDTSSPMPPMPARARKVNPTDSSRTSLTTNHHGLFVSTVMAEKRVADLSHSTAFTETPDSSKSKKDKKARKYKAILPPDLLQPQPASPGPISPEGQSHLANRNGGIQMSNVELPQQPEPVYAAPILRGLPPRPQPRARDNISTDSSANSSIVDTRFVPDPYAVHRVDIEARRQKLEREDAVGQKVGSFWTCSKRRRKTGYFAKKGPEGRKRRRWCLIIIILIILLLIGLGITLAVIFGKKDGNSGQSTGGVPGATETTVVTTPLDPSNTSSPTKPVSPDTSKPSETSGGGKGSDRPKLEEDSRWLNLTGYPPMPTGTSTVAGPDAGLAKSGCLQQSTMWSCSLPKDDKESNKPFDGDQPPFKFDIKFKNGTYEHGTAPKDNGKRDVAILRMARKLGILRQSEENHLGRRDDFSPSPEPPSLEEQAFLGNTTDEVKGQFEGEETPFFVTFLSTSSSSSSSDDNKDKRTLQGRADSNSSSSSNSSSNNDFPDLAALIPPPDLASDGTAAPANLYPLPISQPIRLYDRDLETEHYGFYTYFDRSIFLKSARPIGKDDKADVADDLNGGSTKAAARVRCTWTQTRFIVKIWTKGQDKGGMQLLPQSSSSGSDSDSESNFNRPGSFPYPVTISLDRHGGDPEKKMVYCYGLDTDGQVNTDEKKLQLEWREFGGNIVNPAPGVFNVPSDTNSNGRKGDKDSNDDGDDKDTNKDKRDGGPDTEVEGKGFDGGTGGCRCEWRNWLT